MAFRTNSGRLSSRALYLPSREGRRIGVHPYLGRIQEGNSLVHRIHYLGLFPSVQHNLLGRGPLNLMILKRLTLHQAVEFQRHDFVAATFRFRT